VAPDAASQRSADPVAVAGPTGFTGRLVVAEMARRGIPVRLIGRDAARLEAVARDHAEVDSEVRAVPGWDRKGLARALEGTAAVIACAGPFMQAAKPVVEAAVDAGVPYTDSTGEQPFIRDVYERLDRLATRAGVALVPAFGFDYVPGDLGAAIAAEGLKPPLRIDVVYAVETADSTVGTRRSSLGMATAPCLLWLDGRLTAEHLGGRRRTVTTQFGRRTAGSIPGGEPLMVPRHLDVSQVVGYMALPGPLNPGGPGARVFTALLRMPGVRPMLERAVSRGPAGPNDEQRRSRVACVVQAEGADGRRAAVRVEGIDPYGFTARSLGELAERMRDGRIDAVGARAPAEVVEARGFLEATGLRVVTVDPE
jgi:short subunit dehydrogenase-like uncharacterized protein